MKRVRVTCPQCGDIDLATTDLRGRICVETGQAEYRYRCAGCHQTAVHDTDTRTYEILTAADIYFEPWHLPAELKETRHGLVISHDDLIEFHNLVHNDTHFANALANLESAN